MPDFEFTPLLPLGKDDTPYRLLTTDGVSTFGTVTKRRGESPPAAGPNLTEYVY